MGKSTAADFLRQQGVQISDTDAIARQLVEPGKPALAEIVKQFGPSILQPDGHLNRKELARITFSDKSARSTLEAILHPPIRGTWEAEVKEWRAAGQANGAVIIPLLFETNAASAFDAIICVACSPATQSQRLRERGWSDTEIRARIDAQMPIDQKIHRSDFLIWTDTTLEAHAAQLTRILSRKW
jgi:dephospho-CoA kinase